MKQQLWFVLLIGVVLAGCRRPVKILNPPSEQDIREKRVVFHDLDHTLYSQNTGIYSDAVVIKYVSTHLHMSSEEAKLICCRYAEEFAGQVIKGLENDYGVDPVQFEAWIDKEAACDQVLKPDYEFIEKLNSYNARNWVITNSGWDHAHRLLKTLGLLEHFEAVIYLDYSCKCSPPILKPDVRAFIKAQEYAGVPDPSYCYLVDDIEANGQGACVAGWNAVHFCEPFFCLLGGPRLFRRSDQTKCQDIPKVSSIHDIDAVFPELVA